MPLRALAGTSLTCPVSVGFTALEPTSCTTLALSITNKPESEVTASALEHCEPLVTLTRRLRVAAGDQPVRLALFWNDLLLPTRVRSCPRSCHFVHACHAQ